MPPPTLYIKNALKLALDGLGDGTVYASATSAVVNQQNKTFTLSGLSLIADIGANADDKFNSHHIYFPPSGNKYSIVDWVAATNAATTLETPALGDTGPCEIRRILVDANALAGNPVIALADGRKSNKWVSSSVVRIQCNLPNAVDNGSFESGLLSPWSIIRGGGGTDASGINAANPILGARDFLINRGTQSNVSLMQPIKNFDLKKGKNYRLVFKSFYTDTFVTGGFSIGISDFIGSWHNLTFSDQSSGTTSGISWTPELSASPRWESINFTPTNNDIPINNSGIYFTVTSGDFSVKIDEIYIFEVVNVSDLLIFDPVVQAGNIQCHGVLCPFDRTGYTFNVEAFTLINSTIIGDREVVHSSFSKAIYPTYSIEFHSGVTTASEILLCEKWVWGRHVKGRFDPREVAQRRIDTDTKSGVHNSVKFSENRVLKGKVVNISDVDLKRWNDDFYPLHHQQKHPFAVKIDGTAPLLLMRDKSNSFGNPYDGPRVSMDFDWIEII